MCAEGSWQDVRNSLRFQNRAKVVSICAVSRSGRRLESENLGFHSGQKDGLPESLRIFALLLRKAANEGQNGG